MAEGVGTVKQATSKLRSTDWQHEIKKLKLNVDISVKIVWASYKTILTRSVAVLVYDLNQPMESTLYKFIIQWTIMYGTRMYIDS